MVSRQYLLSPRAKMSEAARNVDYLCGEYLTEMSVVAVIASLAVKKGREPSPGPTTPTNVTPPPPDEPDGEQNFRLIALVNPDGTVHILRVPEDEMRFLAPPPGNRRN